MFKLNRLTDYAVVVMSRMALTPGAVRPTANIAKASNLPLPTVAKVLNILCKADLVTAQRGATGGYRLTRAPESIPVSDIIEALEGPISLTACVEGTPDVCDVEALCPLCGHWDRVNMAIKEALDRVTLAELTFTYLPMSAHTPSKQQSLS